MFKSKHVYEKKMFLIQTFKGLRGGKDRWMDRRMDGWTDGGIERRTVGGDRQMDGWMDGRTDGQTDRWTDGRTDGQKKRLVGAQSLLWLGGITHIYKISKVKALSCLRVVLTY